MEQLTLACLFQKVTTQMWPVQPPTLHNHALAVISVSKALQDHSKQIAQSKHLDITQPVQSQQTVVLALRATFALQAQQTLSFALQVITALKIQRFHLFVLLELLDLVKESLWLLIAPVATAAGIALSTDSSSLRDYAIKHSIASISQRRLLHFSLMLEELWEMNAKQEAIAQQVLNSHGLVNQVSTSNCPDRQMKLHVKLVLEASIVMAERTL